MAKQDPFDKCIFGTMKHYAAPLIAIPDPMWHHRISVTSLCLKLEKINLINEINHNTKLIKEISFHISNKN